MWFAYYLYKNGFVSAEDLIESIGKHHQSKTPVGKLAVDLGMMTEAQIGEVLERQRDSTLGFCELAALMGIIDEEQSVELAGIHLRYVDGWKHLVKNSLLTDEELDFHIKQFHRECLKRFNNSMSTYADC